MRPSLSDGSEVGLHAAKVYALLIKPPGDEFQRFRPRCGTTSVEVYPPALQVFELRAEQVVGVIPWAIKSLQRLQRGRPVGDGVSRISSTPDDGEEFLETLEQHQERVKPVSRLVVELELLHVRGVTRVWLSIVEVDAEDVTAHDLVEVCLVEIATFLSH